MPVSDIALTGSYDPRVVALSVAIAVLAAYARLNLAEGALRPTEAAEWLG